MSDTSRTEALKLPDELLVRYFRADEIERIERVESGAERIEVLVQLVDGERTDYWRDLGGGLGYVPAE